MGKDSFIIYKSFYKPISKLSDKQLGRLFRAIFEYNISGVVSVEEDIEMAFEFFKNQFDIDESKYQGKVERNRENGRRGGNQKAENDKIREGKSKDSECKQTVANASECKRNLANLAYNENDNEKDNDNDLKKGNKSNDLFPKENETLFPDEQPQASKPTKKFSPPTLQDVQAYCKERNNTVDAEHFLAYYQANGWKVGKNPMKDWRAAVRTWERNRSTTSANGQSGVANIPAGVKLGYGERIVDGRRTYGTGKSTIPMNAPPRPGDGYSWSAEANKWVY